MVGAMSTTCEVLSHSSLGVSHGPSCNNRLMIIGFGKLKPAVNSGRTFCDFMETTAKEKVIGFFREVINHIE